MTRILIVALVAGLACLVSAKADFKLRASGPPDVGGTILAIAPTPSLSTASVITLSVGEVLSIEGDAIGGVLLIVTDGNGDLIDTSFSHRDGGFVLVTPSTGPFYLTVPESTVINVPFMPATPITIVLP